MILCKSFPVLPSCPTPHMNGQDHVVPLGSGLNREHEDCSDTRPLTTGRVGPADAPPCTGRTTSV